VALALLIGIWGVFLGVALVRKRAELRADSSIGAFERQLQVLRRNAQLLHRNQSFETGLPVDSSRDGFPTHSLRDGSVVSNPRFQAPQESRQSNARYDWQGVDNGLNGGVPTNERHDPYFRPGACERRRDVLLILVTAVVSTGLISIIPAARMALVLTAISGVALLAYVFLLVRLRAQAFEREMKLRYMPRPAEAPVFAERRVVAR
jgi:hypothetical protein